MKLFIYLWIYLIIIDEVRHHSSIAILVGRFKVWREVTRSRFNCTFRCYPCWYRLGYYFNIFTVIPKFVWTTETIPCLNCVITTTSRQSYFTKLPYACNLLRVFCIEKWKAEKSIGILATTFFFINGCTHSQQRETPLLL